MNTRIALASSVLGLSLSLGVAALGCDDRKHDASASAAATATSAAVASTATTTATTTAAAAAAPPGTTAVNTGPSVVDGGKVEAAKGDAGDGGKAAEPAPKVAPTKK